MFISNNALSMNSITKLKNLALSLQLKLYEKPKLKEQLPLCWVAPWSLRHSRRWVDPQPDPATSRLTTSGKVYNASIYFAVLNLRFNRSFKLKWLCARCRSKAEFYWAVLTCFCNCNTSLTKQQWSTYHPTTETQAQPLRNSLGKKKVVWSLHLQHLLFKMQYFWNLVLAVWLTAA